MKRIVSVCFVVGAILLLNVVDASSQERWALGSSGAGSGPYVWGAWISKIVNKFQNKVVVSSQATAGYNENVELVHAGKIPLGLTLEDDLLDAYKGLGKFRGRQHERLRKLFVANLSVYHIVTREGAGIKTLSDLKGKKVNISLPAMSTRKFAESLLTAANIGLDEIKKFEMATGSTFPSLQDRVIDATINGYSIGHGELMELANNIKIRLIEVPDDVFERVNKILRNTLIRVTIPANSYKGQSEAVITYAGGNVIFSRDDVPEDAIYQFTKAFWNNLAEVQKDPNFKIMKREFALVITEVPIHPGAQKYFREAGLLK
jgi:TRAP transporter TAXI family solute receptor